MPNALAKLYGLTVVDIVITLTAFGAQADGPDISAQHLLETWRGDDSGMAMVAEVIAIAFASGFSWGGKSRENGPIAPLLILKRARL